MFSLDDLCRASRTLAAWVLPAHDLRRGLSLYRRCVTLWRRLSPGWRYARYGLLLATTACVHVGPKSPFAALTSMDGHERVMWELVQAGNQPELRAHMAESFVQSGPEGARDREAVLAEYAEMKLTGFEMSDVQSWPNGADMLITYTLTLRGTLNERPLSGRPVRILTVWQTVKRGWVQVAQGLTPMAQ